MRQITQRLPTGSDATAASRVAISGQAFGCVIAYGKKRRCARPLCMSHYRRVLPPNTLMLALRCGARSVNDCALRAVSRPSH